MSYTCNKQFIMKTSGIFCTVDKTKRNFMEQSTSLIFAK